RADHRRLRLGGRPRGLRRARRDHRLARRRDKRSLETRRHAAYLREGRARDIRARPCARWAVAGPWRNRDPRAGSVGRELGDGGGAGARDQPRRGAARGRLGGARAGRARSRGRRPLPGGEAAGLGSLTSRVTGSKTNRFRSRDTVTAVSTWRLSGRALPAALALLRWPRQGCACASTTVAKSPEERAVATAASRSAVVPRRTTSPGTSSGRTVRSSCGGWRRVPPGGGGRLEGGGFRRGGGLGVGTIAGAGVALRPRTMS